MLHLAHALTWMIKHIVLGLRSLPQMTKHVHTDCIIARPAAVKRTM